MQYTKTKTKSRLCHLLSLCIALTMFQACDVDDLVGLNYDDIESSGSFFGHAYHETVIIHSQGANPSVKLKDAELIDLVKPVNTNDVIVANIRQHQMIEPRPLYAGTLSSQEANLINDNSVTELVDVIRHFKDQGKNVYVLGTGFGGFLVQELIAKYGNGIADKYLIMGSRLDIEDDFVDTWTNGENAEYDYNLTPAGVIKSTPAEIVDGNLNRLFGSIANQDFIQKLESADLANLTFLFSEQDEVVGRLSDMEQNFLIAKNAKLIQMNGGHTSAIKEGVIPGMLEGFGIE